MQYDLIRSIQNIALYQYYVVSLLMSIYLKMSKHEQQKGSFSDRVLSRRVYRGRAVLTGLVALPALTIEKIKLLI